MNAKLSKMSADCKQINANLTALNRKAESNYDPRRDRVEGMGVDGERRHTEHITKSSPAPVSITTVEFDSDGHVKNYAAATAKTAPALSNPSVGAVRTNFGPSNLTDNSVRQTKSTSKIPSSSNRKTRSHTTAPKFEQLGLRLVDVKADGNCLFRALSHQLYDKEGYHRNTQRKHLRCGFQ